MCATRKRWTGQSTKDTSSRTWSILTPPLPVFLPEKQSRWIPTRDSWNWRGRRLKTPGSTPRYLLSKSDTSVIKGVDSDDYSRLLLEDLPNVEAWMGIRTQPHGVANRIFHQLDLMGPSSAVGRRSLCILIGCDSPRQTSHRAWGVPGSHCRWRACLLLSGTVPDS